MLLSRLIKEFFGDKFDCIFCEEKEFDVLGIVNSRTELPMCTFVDNKKFFNELPENVTMVITSPELTETAVRVGKGSFGMMTVDNPRQFFFSLHNFLAEKREYCRKEEDTIIDPTADVSPLAYIAEKNVRIGKSVKIEPFVVIYENSEIGDNSVIRAGAKIGGQGFEFKRAENKILSVKHLGGVKIGKHVEIQNNTCIDRAIYPWDNTSIGDYTKVDNLVYIGHAAKISKNVMIVANSGIGGRTVIEPNSWIGLGATLRNGIKIGKNARANMGSVVTKDVAENESVTGNFAVSHEKFIQELRQKTGKTD